jgi:hypothetical protein
MISKQHYNNLNDNLEIAILGHEKERLARIPKFKIFKPLLLQELKYSQEKLKHNKFAESRIFFSDFEFDKSKKVVGCLTSSWDEKFNAPKLLEIYSWNKLYINFTKIIKGESILCGGLCRGESVSVHQALWRRNFQKHFRKVFPNSDFIENGIFKITNMRYCGLRPAPYANQFICKKDFYNRYKDYLNKIITNLLDYFYGLTYKFDTYSDRTFAYILEEVSMLWWSKQDNISFISMGDVRKSWVKKK